jgi:hypothetical protein
MGSDQSCAQGIQNLPSRGDSYKNTIANLMGSYRKITSALFPSTKRGGTSIITLETSGYIETLSLVDALLTNVQIKTRFETGGLMPR